MNRGPILSLKYNSLYVLILLINFNACTNQYDPVAKTKSMCANYFMQIMSSEVQNSRKISKKINKAILDFRKTADNQKETLIDFNKAAENLEKNLSIISRGYWCDDHKNGKEQIIAFLDAYKKNKRKKDKDLLLVKYFSSCDEKMFKKCEAHFKYPLKECANIKIDTKEWKDCFKEKSSTKTSIGRILYEESDFHKAIKNTQFYL